MKDLLMLYRNYLALIEHHEEYGDRYGDTQELIKIYERELDMKEPYRWNYNIKIKTKEGTFEYEDKLENIETLLEKHPNYEEVSAKKKTKKLVKHNKPTKK